jgi:hypothetical protein
MTDAGARIGEAISTKAISSKKVSREGAVGSEERPERGGGTGSGWTNGLVQGCRIQNSRHSCDPDSAANELIDLVPLVGNTELGAKQLRFCLLGKS